MVKVIGRDEVNQDNMEVKDTKGAPVTRGRFNSRMIGASGTMIFSGYYDEEYLNTLSGTSAADLYDQMRRSDGQINMLLTARKNPILTASKSIEPGHVEGATPELEDRLKRQAEHVEYEFFTRQRKPFTQLLEEILSFEDFGFSIFERVHQAVKNDVRFGTYMGYKNIAWRSQRTIEEWHLTKDGSIDRIFQQADGDQGAYTTIPGQFLTVFTLKKIGDNYEGISALRHIYGNWFRKNIYLKLLGIGIERYAINTPVGRVPIGKESSQEYDNFVEMLKRISSHQSNYFTMPEGWEVDFLKNPFDADKVIEAIRYENTEMTKSFVANHLELGVGTKSGGGSYSLGTDLSDQFLSIIQNDADILTRTFNKEIIREFIDLNYGPQPAYPELKFSGINDKAGKEYAEVVKMLVDAGALTKTENLEDFLRETFKLPPMLESDKAAISVAPAEPEPTPPESVQNKELKLQEDSERVAKITSKVEQEINASIESVRKLMSKELKKRSDKMITDVKKKLKNADRLKWHQIAADAALEGHDDYVAKLERELAQVAAKAVNQARSEIPGGKSIKFGENLKTRITLAEKDDVIKSLPEDTRELTKAQAKLLAQAQDADLQKEVLLLLNGSISDEVEIEDLIAGMEAARDDYIEGPGVVIGAANAASKQYNTARVDFFNLEDVAKKVKGFKFTNEAPVSQICKELTGRIFAPEDPAIDIWSPPLHHNCKSYWVPMLDEDNPEISEPFEPSEKAQGSVTLKVNPFE